MTLIGATAKKYGIPTSLANALIGQESGGKPDAVSSKGAVGLTQVLPSTAAGMYGISEQEAARRLRDPGFALDAGFRYLAAQKKAFGSWRLALAAYNAGPNAVRDHDGVPPFAETEAYVRNILAKAGALGSAGVALAAPTAPTALAEQPQPELDTTAFALQTLSDTRAGSYDPQAALRQLALSQTLTAAPTAAPAQRDPHVEQPKVGTWGKWVRLAKGADRAGAETAQSVLSFVGSLGRRYGRPLTIGTGTNHNQFVVGTQRESQHWTGHAADIPATGAKLLRLGRLALVQAGMSRRDARKATGGIYNVGGYQVIFRTNEGGNHWNHLHVGVR